MEIIQRLKLNISIRKIRSNFFKKRLVEFQPLIFYLVLEVSLVSKKTEFWACTITTLTSKISN